MPPATLDRKTDTTTTEDLARMMKRPRERDGIDDFPDHAPALTEAEEKRRGDLIEKSFLAGLTHAESMELARLQYVGAFDPSSVDFYRPIFEQLDMPLPRFVTPPPGPMAPRASQAAREGRRKRKSGTFRPVDAWPQSVDGFGVTWWAVAWAMERDGQR